ncbi:hypothetical protein ACFLYW_02680 [Thermodesulfobacteriota bacterium]
MIEQTIITLAQGKVGWTVLGSIGVIAGFFMVYYISFAIYVFLSSIYSGFKLIPENYRIWRGELTPEWNGAALGVTMPDGGKPADE